MARSSASFASTRRRAIGALAALLAGGSLVPAANAAPAVAYTLNAAVPLAAVMAASQCDQGEHAALPSLGSPSKASLIIGGQPSALEALIAQQSGQASVEEPMLDARPNPSAGFARLVCAERPQGAIGMMPMAPSLSGRSTSRDFGNVFDFSALRVAATPFDSDWKRVTAGRGQSVSLAASTLARADSAVTERRAMVERVNRWVNARVRFASDSLTYGQRDYWADANETLGRRQGDCEDYAIAKMQILKAAGVPDADLQLVVVRDLVRRSDHAVLIVRVDDGLLLLDNNTDLVVDASRSQDYIPVFSYSAGRKWVHGRRYQPAPAPINLRFASASR